MIEFIRGQVAFIESEYVVLDVNGVGYQIYCAQPVRFAAGSELTLHTHQHVREDTLLLFGFVSREELLIFRQLLEVSGIGPKVALGILANGSPSELLWAIQQENVAFLTRLPGIGKKTAQRMILDLKDRTKGMAAHAGMSEKWLGVKHDDGAMAPASSTMDQGVWAEVKEALRSLGYSEAEVVRAGDQLRAEMNETDSADQWIKRALQILYNG